MEFKQLLLDPLGLFKQTVKDKWVGEASCMILKFESYDDYSAAYRFFKSKFDPRCFNTVGGIMPELFINRRGMADLSKMWKLTLIEPTNKNLEIKIPSRMEAFIQLLIDEKIE